MGRLKQGNGSLTVLIRVHTFCLRHHHHHHHQEAVSFIRGQINSGKANPETLFSKFKFASCYDIAFLHNLAKEFNVNISDILKKKRVNHTDVLNALISKLLLS